MNIMKTIIASTVMRIRRRPFAIMAPVALAGVLFALPAPSGAATLVEYNFDTDSGGPNANTFSPAAGWDSGLKTPGDVAFAPDAFNGVGQGGATSPGSYGRISSSGKDATGGLLVRLKATGDIPGSPVIVSTDAATAIATSSYVEFTVAPENGGTVSFAGFSAWLGLYDGNSGANRPFTATIFLCSSVDGFGTSNILGSKAVSTSTGSSKNNGTLDVDFSGFGDKFQEIGESVTFRLYIFASQNGETYPSSAHHVYLDQFVLTGSTATTAVPEPASAAFILALTMLATGLWQVRRHRGNNPLS
ncbi:hypothetical protein OpiT1DRAFT_02954 [Opitutaceae bacterium TAV1]|nr:hypothetical protein OpiT1DRAFT_02954 [Opitutaceae bacterium TAV1]